MNVNRIDHLCIAVRDLAEASARWEPILGKDAPDESYVDEPEGIRVHRYYVGEVGVELITPLSASSDVAGFLERHGEGLMLLALNVDSARAAEEELRGKDYRIVGEPRPFRDGEYTFVHPRSVNGVLLELIDQGGARDR